jgi:phospholipase/lecithinase/hemolysin
VELGETEAFGMLDDLSTPDGPYAAGGHHFSNGATWIEDLARTMSLSGSVRPAFVTGGQRASNYAAGGARAAEINPFAIRCRANFADQVDAYLDDFAATPPKTLVVIEMGSNDVRDALEAGLGAYLQTMDPVAARNAAAQVLAAAGAAYGDQVARLVASGATRFLITNVPNIGLSPAVQQIDGMIQAMGGPAGLVPAFANEIAIGFNAGIAQLVSVMAGMQLDVRVLDFYALLDDVIAHPSSYGLTDAVHACVTPDKPPFRCTKPDTYVFWDGVHPTKVMHAIIADEAADALK